MVQEAVDGGITFFDNCWEYHRGKSEDWMGKGLKGKRDKAIVSYAHSLAAREDSAVREEMESLAPLTQ